MLLDEEKLYSEKKVFDEFISKQPGGLQSWRQRLEDNQQLIIEQVLANLNFKKKSAYTKEEKSQIIAELERIIKIYSDNPYLGKLVGNNEELEDENGDPESPEFKEKIARNLLRCLFRAQPLDRKLAKSFKLIMASVCKRKDEKLFQLVKVELQKSLDKLWKNINTINSSAVKQEIKKADFDAQVGIFLNYVLGICPFLGYKNGDHILLPQKTNGLWQQVDYEIKKIDMSPKSGVLSWFLEDEDRIYAYVLEAKELPGAPCHLSIPGTTYPTGEGFLLSMLENIHPGKSVGEGHDTTEIEQWICKNNNVNIMGISKGATLSMIMALKYPDHVRSAICINPTGLAANTISDYDENEPDRKLCTDIRIYTHENDPIFLLGDFIPSMAQVSYMIPKQYVSLKAYAHVFPIAGNNDILTVRLNPTLQNFSYKRQFLSNLKGIINVFGYPFFWVVILFSLIEKRYDKFYEKHKIALWIIFGLLGICIMASLLLFTTVLNPFLVKIKSLRWIEAIGPGGILTSTIALAGFLAAFLPRIVSILLTLLKYTAYVVVVTVVIGATLIGIIFSVIALLFKR